MANQLLRLPSKLKPSQIPLLQQVAGVHGRSKIGSREVVGFGVNGEANYNDRIMSPFPAIRFKEDTPDIKALREKERGDWKKLSIEDKKALYRASFCQTFAEMRAPTGRWKSTIGCAIGFIALSWWMYVWAKVYVYPPVPKTLSLENRQAQLRRMIDLRVDQVDGLSSKWDYENNRWKK
jgi:cytochrome c oxidase subunit 4